VVVSATQAPTAQIIEPTIEGAYYSDQLIFFSAQIQDAEDEATALMYEWVSSQDGILPLTSEPNTDGTIEGYALLSEGQHAITLRVEDSSGKTTTESLAISVGASNTEPSCSITDPITGSSFVEGQDIGFSAVVDDADINNSLLSIQWESNIDGVFNTDIPNTDGSIGFAYGGLSAGTHTVSLRVEDEVGGLCVTSTQLIVGSPPILQVSSPTSGGVYSVASAILFSATVTDQEDLSSDIAMSWESDIDGVLSSQSPDSSGIVTFSTSALSSGLHNIFVSATDTSGLSTTSSLFLRINNPPTQPSISISPSSADAQDDLLLIYGASSDADGDPITYSIEWLKDGVLTSHTGDTIPSSETMAGEIWTAKVTPNDGYTDGMIAQESVEIINSAPTFTTVATISPSAGVYTGTTLVCSAVASDIDDGNVPITYQWSVSSNILSSSSSYTILAQDSNVGDGILCTATAIDSDGEVTTSTASVVVENTIPVLTGPSISPTNIYNTDTLICSAFVFDPDEPNLGVQYSWEVANSIVSSSSSLDLSTTSAVPMDSVICTASSTDDQGVFVSGSASLTVQNRPPEAPTVAVSPSAPIEAVDSLVCSITSLSTDPDGDTPTYLFSWDVDGQSYTSASTTSTTSVVASTEIASGEIWTCTVTPNDGIDDGLSASASVEVTSDWDGQREFDSCGISGRYGPTQGNCNSSYSGTALDGEVTVTAGIQYWTVPSNGTYSIEAWGAQGGAGTTNGGVSGGEGAYVYGEFTLQAGDELKILVGQKADGISRGTSNAGGGGGGGSFIAYSSDDTPLLVAGGGGGTGANSGVVTSSTDGQGGSTPGVSSSNGSIASGGQGGYAGHDGGGGGGYYGIGANSLAGYGGVAFVSGGTGGDYSSSSTYPAGSHIGYGGFGGGGGVGHAGGGGGGYTGGNGTGTYGNGSWSGGGSSYNDGSNPNSQSGARSGDGLVVINKL
ncbi:MAG: hypothetical protein CL916_15220, partial [Deltaproteobacteria bacterium]|nr:hypothetical protein [Deltaproteobacteria bacterium]